MGAAWNRLSRDSGFTGLTKLVTLYELYGFNVLLDTPIDLMRNLPMNVVKKNLRRFIDKGHINRELESRLENFPWTPEMRASRYPSGITTRLSYWKAEDYQKFCFPASKVIFNDLMRRLMNFSVGHWWYRWYKWYSTAVTFPAGLTKILNCLMILPGATTLWLRSYLV